MLVPKLVLVASHCPGRKLLDEQGDEGQLDYLYDEACELGCKYTKSTEDTLYNFIKHVTILYFFLFCLIMTDQTALSLKK